MRITNMACLGVWAVLALVEPGAIAAEQTPKPNVVIILTDDKN